MNPTINLYNTDCLPAMQKMADNQYDLAIVDPPYGLDIVEKSSRLGKSKDQWKSGGRFKYYKYSNWDKNTPNDKYFNELLRISKNQIIWGWNFFSYNFSKSKCFIVWNKIGRDDRADGELAWTSFDKPAKIFDYSRADAYINDCDIKIHPTQKPVKLYKWLLKNYAKQGDKILDTHFGSLSIGIACWDYDFDLDAYEIGKDYFEAGKNRLEIHMKRPKPFFKELDVQNKDSKLNKFF